MGGFENDVVVAKNLNFDEFAAKPHLGILNAAGKFPIGTGNSSPTPEILGGTITSPSGTVTVGYVSPNITLDVASSFVWNVVTSATNPTTLVKKNGYIPKGAGVVQFMLPAAAAIGDTFIIAGYGNLWTLGQNAGQSITLGTQTTQVGVLGSVTATQVRDVVEIVCVTANTEFQIISGVGNLTIV